MNKLQLNLIMSSAKCQPFWPVKPMHFLSINAISYIHGSHGNLSVYTWLYILIAMLYMSLLISFKPQSIFFYLCIRNRNESVCIWCLKILPQYSDDMLWINCFRGPQKLSTTSVTGSMKGRRKCLWLEDLISVRYARGLTIQKTQLISGLAVGLQIGACVMWLIKYF